MVGLLASAWHLQVFLPCPVLSLSLSLSVSKWWHVWSIRHLMCPAHDHYIVLTLWLTLLIMFVTCVLSLIWPRCWYFYPGLWFWAYFFPFWYVPPQVCSALVWWVFMYLYHPYNSVCACRHIYINTFMNEPSAERYNNCCDEMYPLADGHGRAWIFIFDILMLIKNVFLF